MSSLVLDPTTDPILERRRTIQAIASASVRRRTIASKVALGICWACLGSR